MHSTRRAFAPLALALCLLLTPMSAFAADAALQAENTQASSMQQEETSSQETAADELDVDSEDETVDSEDEAVDDQAESDEANESDSQTTDEADLDEADETDLEQDEESDKAALDEQQLQAEKKEREKAQAELKAELEKLEAEEQEKAEAAAKKAKQEKEQAVNKVLKYKRSDIEKIGTQEQTGHSICCPSFSCAYGDAVLDGTVHDHSYYTCSCCTWNDWGGGASVNRCVGSGEELLREAYDQISAGKPTVIHVGYSSGEHWVCLIGYKNAKDPDHLTLDNFIALDPWDGAEITASERCSLYGDGCEHISSR